MEEHKTVGHKPERPAHQATSPSTCAANSLAAVEFVEQASAPPSHVRATRATTMRPPGNIQVGGNHLFQHCSKGIVCGRPLTRDTTATKFYYAPAASHLTSCAIPRGSLAMQRRAVLLFFANPRCNDQVLSVWAGVRAYRYDISFCATRAFAAFIRCLTSILRVPEKVSIVYFYSLRGHAFPMPRLYNITV